MPFADLKDVRLHYELTGSEQLPVLVLSNSLGVSLGMWEAQMAALAPHFRVLRYDTRGLGGSSIPPGPYSMEQLGNDVIALLDTLGIEKASFCGISMGGSTGQWLGIHASDRIRKLVLASTAAKIGNAETWNVRIATVLEDGLGTVIPGTLERWFTAPFREARPDVLASVEAMLQSADRQGYVANCAAVRDADFREELDKIGIPALVILGTHDVSTTPRDGRFLAAHITEAQYLELNAAHMCNMEAADGFNAAVLEFLMA